MDRFARQRAAMVETDLAARGINDARVLAAMGAVPREEFLPPHLWQAAYADHPLPIGHGQTISQPLVVALTAQLARLLPRHRVLDVGTGCGYAAAVYSLLAGEVISLEIEPAFAQGARERLARLGYPVRVVHGDAHNGFPDAAPYDAILSAAAAARVPGPWRVQLRVGGRIVAPIGPPASQRLEVHERTSEESWQVADHGAVRYVPLRSR